jgi:hypothetical protein
MDNIRLLSFAAAPTLTSAKLSDILRLSPISTLNSPGEINYKVYADQFVPVGTKNFLFYAKAVDNTAETPITTMDDKFKFGVLNAKGLTDAEFNTPNDILFSLEQINTNTDRQSSNEVGMAIVDLLTSLANTTVSGVAAPHNAWKTTTNATLAVLYKNFLGREPDERGLADWVNALESGRATGAKVVSGFVLSQEFQNHPLDNEDYVTALYRIIFNREPDAQGLANWIAVLENGCTKKRVLAGFVNSDEFKALCKKLGVEPGHYDSDELPDLYPKVAGFVARLYKICLGRMYDQAGLNAWVTVLVTKEASGSKVARNFFHSKEFYNRDLGNGAFVRVAYQTLLDRDPEAAGFENWTNALEHGLSRDDVIEGFLDSKEFGNICQYYDIVR